MPLSPPPPLPQVQLDTLPGMSLMAGKALSSARMSDAVLSQSSLMASQQLHGGDSEGGLWGQKAEARPGAPRSGPHGLEVAAQGQAGGTKQLGGGGLPAASWASPTGHRGGLLAGSPRRLGGGLVGTVGWSMPRSASLPGGALSDCEEESLEEQEHLRLGGDGSQHLSAPCYPSTCITDVLLSYKHPEMPFGMEQAGV